jgi:hypothetical protein
MDKVPIPGQEQVLYVNGAGVLVPALVVSVSVPDGAASLRLLDGSNTQVTNVPYSRALGSGSWPPGSWHFRGGF